MTRKDAIKLAIALGAMSYKDGGEIVLKKAGHPTMRIGVGSHANQGLPPYVRSWLRRISAR